MPSEDINQPVDTLSMLDKNLGKKFSRQYWEMFLYEKVKRQFGRNDI